MTTPAASGLKLRARTLRSWENPTTSGWRVAQVLCSAPFTGFYYHTFTSLGLATPSGTGKIQLPPAGASHRSSAKHPSLDVTTTTPDPADPPDESMVEPKPLGTCLAMVQSNFDSSAEYELGFEPDPVVGHPKLPPGDSHNSSVPVSSISCPTLS